MVVVSRVHVPGELRRSGMRRAAVGPAMSPLQGWVLPFTVGYKHVAPGGAKNDLGLSGRDGFLPEELDFILNYRGFYGGLGRPDRRERPSAGERKGVAKSPVRGRVFAEINLRRTGSSRRQILCRPRASVVVAVFWRGQLSRFQPTSIHL